MNAIESEQFELISWFKVSLCVCACVCLNIYLCIYLNVQLLIAYYYKTIQFFLISKKQQTKCTALIVYNSCTAQH